MPDAPQDPTGRAAALCAGPRGAGLCLAVARQVHPPVQPALFAAAGNASDERRRRELVDVLGEVDPGGVRRLGAATGFVDAVTESVAEARYWQEPVDEDVVGAFGDVRAALLPVACAVLATDVARHWSDPCDRAAQRSTQRFERLDAPPGPPVAGARDRLERWREEALAADRRAARKRPRDPAAPWSGAWWSSPVGAGLVATTGPLGALPAASLAWEEDDIGLLHALVRPTLLKPDARILEIDGPEQWSALVATHALDVSASRRHDWYRSTGRDGAWLIPDYRAVAAEWDAVHLTVLGYLTTAGRSVPVRGGAATVLAGWAPDQTWWLTDAIEVVGPGESWYRDDDRWVRTPWTAAGDRGPHIRDRGR